MRLHVAGIQMVVTHDVGANAAAILRAVEAAREAEAEILVTPEGSLSGYTHAFDARAVEQALASVTSSARRAGVGLALGTCWVEPSDGKCYDQLRFYDRNGVYLGFHSKILLCGTLAEPAVGEINHYATSPLRTFDFHGTVIGGLVCNDFWANPSCTPMPDPHLSQELARMGARVVFHAVNGGRGPSEWRQVAWQFHEANLRMRARAGSLYVVTVDSCHPVDLPCSAPSGVIGPDGAWVLKVPDQGERFFTGMVELE